MNKSQTSSETTIAASQLADMGFCETKVFLKSTLGDRDTEQSAKLRGEGKAKHQAIHEAAVQHHNRRPSPVDKRCFIATAVYGVNDPRTDQLRRFRDERLMGTSAGRKLVGLYYWISPSIADFITEATWLRPIVERMLDAIRSRIAPVTDKEADHEHEQSRPPAR